MKKYWLLIILAYWLFFILTPPLQTPDENDHYETVYWLSQGIYPHQPTNRKLISPRFTQELFSLVDLKMKQPNRNLILPNYKRISQTKLKQQTQYSTSVQARFVPITLQSYQTPLYHLSAAAVFTVGQWLKLSLWHLSYLTRITSMFYYFSLVFISLKSLRIIFKKPATANYLWLFFSLNPTVIRSGISINPDIAMAFFSALFLYFLLKCPKRLLLLALSAAASALAKFSGLFTAAIYNFATFVSRESWRTKIKHLLIFNLIFLIPLAPWLYLNYARYGTITTTQGFFIASSHQIIPRPLLNSVVLAALDFRHTLMHFSGFLGAGNERYPFKWFFLMYTVALAVLGLWGLWKFSLSKNPYRQAILTYGFFYFTFLYYLAFFFQKSGLNWDIQGRYFLNGFFLLTIFLGFVVRPKWLAYFSVWHYLFILSFVLIPGYYV